MITALLLCGSATAATVNSTNITSNFTTNKLVSKNPYPDLVVKNVTVPSIGVKGKPITVVNSIKNQGNTGSKGFYVNYYLKNTSSSKPIYIGRRYITSLGAGKTNTKNTQLTIANTIANTTYYIMVYADYTNLIKESNETNNHNYSKTKINILNSGRPVYITSDNINKYTADDIARINNIVLGLQSLGLYAVNYGVGPNEHDNIIFNTTKRFNCKYIWWCLCRYNMGDDPKLV
jgi:subtilase family serine protease